MIKNSFLCFIFYCLFDRSYRMTLILKNIKKSIRKTFGVYPTVCVP